MRDRLAGERAPEAGAVGLLPRAVAGEARERDTPPRDAVRAALEDDAPGPRTGKMQRDRAAAPAGDGRASFVSRDDLADVAVAVLRDDSGRFDGQALDVSGPAALTMAEAAAVLTEVTGPEALTMAEAADVLTEITGIPAEYRPETIEEAWASRRPSGHPDWEIEGWVTSYVAIAEGELAGVTDVVPSLTGHPALTGAEHLRRHPADWAGLRR